MESTIANTNSQVIKVEEVENRGSLGKYLDKQIVPGFLYIVEQAPNFMASCLCNISKPMLVFSSKASAAQLLMEAAESKRDVCKALSALEKKPIWIDDSENLMAINLYSRCQKLKTEHDLKVVLLDDYRLLVDDYYQEISDEQRITMLQRLAEKLGIAVISQDCPPKEAKEGESNGKNPEQVFHVNWWDDTPKTETNSIFDYWEQ
jgi:replicative DNA helicase